MKILSNVTELPGAYVVNSLQPSVNYLFFLVPFYKHIKGRPSNSRTAKTHEDCMFKSSTKFIFYITFLKCCVWLGPSKAPQHVEPTAYNSSSVYLKWNPPPDNTHNGAITGYQVVIQGGASWDVLSNVTVSASTPTLLLTNLTAGVRYKVMIAAATKIGFGPYTDPIILPTDSMNQIK